MHEALDCWDVCHKQFYGWPMGKQKIKKKKLKNYCFLQVNKITHLSIIKPFTLSKQINLICTNNCIKFYNSFLKSLQFKTAWVTGKSLFSITQLLTKSEVNQ